MTTAQQDDRWQQAYNNAAERLFGLVAGDAATDEQDEACIAEADSEVACA
jgi:hypothetical protein